MGSCFRKQEQKQVEEKPEPTIIKNVEEIRYLNVIRNKQEAFRDDYVIGQSIGHGKYSEVRKCRNKKTNIVRAVRILRKDKMEQGDFDQFNNLIDLTNQLDHPNILQMYERYEDEKRLYLVTELCTGGELYDEILAKQIFTEKEAAMIISQIIQAISYCHKKGIIHRDLKPENVLLDSKHNNNLKIIDFQSAVQIESGHRPPQMLKNPYGTSYYIAPEVLLSEYDEKCDIWSIGVILYILLAGKPPFDGKNDREIVKKVRKGEFDLDPLEMDDVTLEAKDLIRKLLAYDPMTRLSGDEALRHPWLNQFNQQEEDNQALKFALKNLSDYNTQQKLQEAVITFMVGQLASKEDIIDLQRAFKVLDTNHDGTLSREELTVGYEKIYGDRAAEEVDKVFAKIDIDGSGQIDYSEWVVATINKKKLLTQEKLFAAFKLFDKDGGGTISPEEVKEILCAGQDIQDDVWEKVISSVDGDGSGEIDFEEFCQMMNMLIDDPQSLELV